MEGGRTFRTHWWAWVGLFCAVLAILFLRAPEMLLAPSLLFDEGARVFAHFYEHRDAAQILRFKSGYLPLVGNLIGYLAVRLPTRIIPYGFACSAVLITSVTYCVFFARPFRKWFPSDLDRALLCLVFALAPISDCLLVTMSDYSLWNLLALLILLILCRPPVVGGWRYAYAALCNLLVWAHPLTIVIAPVVLWFAIKEKENRGFYGGLLFNLVVHQVFGVAGILTMNGLWQHGGGVHVGIVTQFLHACAWTAQIVVATAFRTAFGSPQLEWAIREQPALLIIWMVLLVAACALIAWRVPRTRAVFGFLGYLIIGLTFFCCFFRYEDVHDDPLHFISYSPRYIYLQSLCSLVLFGTLLTAGYELMLSVVGSRESRTAVPFDKLRASSNRRYRAEIGRLAFLPLVLLIGYYYVLNAQFGHYLISNTRRASPYYDPDPQNGIIVREFFSRLAETERQRGSHNGIQLTAEKIKDWPISVDTTAPASPMSLRMSHRARVIAVLLALVALGYLLRRFWMTRSWGRGVA